MKRKLTYLIILALNICFSFLSAQTKSIDSVKTLLQNTNNDSIRCELLSNLSDLTSGYERIKYEEKIIEISEYHIRNDKDKKNDVFYKSTLALFLNDLGAIYSNQGEGTKALDYSLRSADLYQSIGDSSNAALLYSQIASIYADQENYVKEREYCLKSIALMEKIRLNEGIAANLLLLGNSYEYLEKDLEKALEYYQKSYGLSQNLNQEKTIAYSLGNISRIYFKQNDLVNALKFNFESLKIKEKINDKVGIGYSYHKIGQIYQKQDDLKSALAYGKKSMDIANELGYPENIKRSAELLSSVYDKKGEYKNAFEMYKLFVLMRDSLNNTALQKASLQKDLNLKHEQEKFQIQLEQEKTNAIAQEQKQKQRTILYSVIFGLILVLTFSFFLFRRFKITQRQKLIIEEQKNLVEDKQKEILDSIRYAKRIQTSLLPTDKYIDKVLGGKGDH